MYEYTYNSNERTDFLKLTALYYNAINPSKITFEMENVIATVDSLGHIEFFDMEENSMGFVDFPVSDDPSEKAHTAQYGSVQCKAADNKIIFELPIYDWKDYYPHCDGESDRWDRFEIGSFNVIFDCDTKEISIIGRD